MENSAGRTSKHSIHFLVNHETTNSNSNSNTNSNSNNRNDTPLPYDPIRVTPAGPDLGPCGPQEASFLRSLAQAGAKNPLRFGPPRGAALHTLPVNSNYSSSSNNNIRKRPVDESENSKRFRTNTEGRMVAQHYSSRQNTDVIAREDSPIIGLKRFNNWIKQVLISKHARGDTEGSLKVLDIGCGKGGDLKKWDRMGTSTYLGVDIAEGSIKDAKDRYNNMRLRFRANFYTMDCYNESLESIVPEGLLFDVVSMQFCLHYAYQSPKMVHTMFENITRHLRPGGRFIITIPDSRILLEKLDEIPEGTEPLCFGNSVFNVTFDTRETSSFGHRYFFYLEDAVENVPEYVVPWTEFVELAAEYNLKLNDHTTFHESYLEASEEPQYKRLLQQMRVVNEEGESQLDEDMWNVADFYLTAAFTKVE